MKPTTRATLAAVITGVTAAVGAAATPAVAATGTIPVPVPLDGVSRSLGVEMPQAVLDVPLLTPGVPEGPRFVTGRLMPERTVPQVPIRGALPGVNLRTPVPHLIGGGADHIGVGTPASALRTLTPGLALDAPLTPPNPGRADLPDLKMPQAAVIGPVLQTVAGADLSTGPGR
ncbi:hypothetical protein [Streptomyces echinatus]|uniref:Secreted protein n=1 Tax=Streptomyces echinatus TaxID=67293 RepID=A0A7W9PPC4_9ACTN|nr:hypothetical protein [Streptomyces echinatus]MBB5924883.1 hypothetical protein [Streptomyces echinatus]